MSDRVNKAILRALRREEVYLKAQIHEDDGLKDKAAKIRTRLRQVEDELNQAARDLAEVRDEIRKRT